MQKEGLAWQHSMVFALSLNIFKKFSLVFVNRDQFADWLLLESNHP